MVMNPLWESPLSSYDLTTGRQVNPSSTRSSPRDPRGCRSKEGAGGAVGLSGATAHREQGLESRGGNATATGDPLGLNRDGMRQT